MSLITRCPACGTMFKVVTDQLKVSQGWVRCGHCSEVFDASLHLQSAPEPASPSPRPPETFNSSPVYAPSSDPAPEPAGQPKRLSEPDPEAAWSPGVFFVDSQGLPSSESQTSAVDSDHLTDFDSAAWKQGQAVKPLNKTDTLELNEFSEATREHAIGGHGPVSDSVAAPEDREGTLSEFPLEAADATQDVSFVRDARREAMWRSPGVRVALGFIALVLIAVLFLQVLVQQRDSVAALEPRFKPWLKTLCSYMQCEVAPLRRIESVVIDSSSFNKLDADSYRLSFSLKNTGTAQVAMPSLEVTLTDMQDQALVRRVLTPAELGLAVTILGAGSEAAGVVVMQVLDNNTATAAGTPASNVPASTGPLRVVGYRVLAFYP